jgi:glycine cleavage system H lipoate-binding protein
MKTTYYDYCLVFDSKEIADSVLFDVENGIKIAKFVAVDVIGKIYKNTGNVIDTPEGLINEVAAIKGWHVNVRHSEPVLLLEQYKVTPKTPERVWAT